MTRALHWFRDDLRLADNPALRAAAADGPVLCLYIFDEGGDRQALGGASRWWLSRSLQALSKAIEAKGGELVLMRGDPAEIMPAVVEQAKIEHVTWNRRYEAPAIALDKALKEALSETGVEVESFNGKLLNEPWEVLSKAGQPMKVFTPYWRAARAKGEPETPLPAPRKFERLALPNSLSKRKLSLADLALEPSKPDWAGGLRESWTPGETGAHEMLESFIGGRLAGYAEDRNRPDRAATSQLSPHLRFGEISPRQIWHALALAREAGEAAGSATDAEKFLSELGWREFSYQLLFHNPDLATRNYDERFDAFPWRKDAQGLRRWQRGQTGIPLIDAGMRQLWQTGWMHNRVRMVVASFLVKHMLVDWRIGEAWFWDTLVDADLASNVQNWQWVAGSGADASPYFRIFNPIAQGEKFDRTGRYVRRWVPELSALPDKWLHAPWTAPTDVLQKAGIRLGDDYPHPILNHGHARARALDALKAVSGRGDDMTDRD